MVVDCVNAAPHGGFVYYFEKLLLISPNFKKSTSIIYIEK